MLVADICKFLGSCCVSAAEGMLAIIVVWKSLPGYVDAFRLYDRIKITRLCTS